MSLNRKPVIDIITRALAEDLGQAGDITTDNLINPEHRSKGIIEAKDEGIIAGLPVAEMVFHQLDPDINFKPLKKEGGAFKTGDKIAELRGRTRNILKGERIALNFLQRLSGIATTANKYVNCIKDFSARIVDTRKTTPTLRILEKYAVKVGGASNHRMGLYDAVLIKDNHIKACGGVEKAVTTIKKKIAHTVKVEIEVENMEQIKQALTAEVDIILLDNMGKNMLRDAVDYISGRAITEASGGITEENLKEVAATGVDIISIGALTHQINSLDLSLDLQAVLSHQIAETI